jgi:hypothetical protein
MGTKPIEFYWSKQGCFDFFLNLSELGLALLTHDLSLAFG